MASDDGIARCWRWARLRRRRRIRSARLRSLAASARSPEVRAASEQRARCPRTNALSLDSVSSPNRAAHPPVGGRGVRQWAASTGTGCRVRAVREVPAGQGNTNVLFDMFGITWPSSPPDTTAFVLSVVDAPALQSFIARELMVSSLS